MELPKQIVVLSHRTLPMETWMRTPGSLTARVVNICLFFMRKVVLRSMGVVVTSPAIFKPIDKRSDVQEQQILHLRRPFTKRLQLAQLHQSKILLATEEQLALVGQLFQLEDTSGRCH